MDGLYKLLIQLKLFSSYNLENIFKRFKVFGDILIK